MNNLPLQPLVWKDYGKGTASETRSALHEYDAWQTDNDRGWIVGYFDRRNPTGIKEATGFATIDEAKAWAWNHYNEKMQPYVKPTPTWIDVDERLPESECFYLVRLFDGHRDEHVFVILWWNSEHQQFLEWDAMCEPTHWMPIPEFSTMQNLHKGE